MSEQTKSKGKVTLVILLLLFVLPVVASWYLVFFTDYARDGEEGGGAEHGELIKPPRQLENVQFTRAAVDSIAQVPLFGKWTMVLLLDGECKEVCASNLYRLRQIRLATGKEMSHVQRVVVTDGYVGDQFSDYLNKNFPGQLYVSKNDLSENFIRKFQDLKLDDRSVIFLVDPRGFLMMRYTSENEPSGIIRDLSRLLRISS